MKKYDLIVIGCGPSGEKAAVKAAYFGYSVAIIEMKERLGGAGINTGTLPSKTLKETALFFSSKHRENLFGAAPQEIKVTSIEQFMYRTKYVIAVESLEVFNNISRHKVQLYRGIGRFVDPHIVEVVANDGSCDQIYGDYIIIATGSYPFHPPHLPFDSRRVHDSDSILTITRVPQSICILGAGVIGCEYATIFAYMNTKTTLVHPANEILTFLDREMANALLKQMKRDEIGVLLNATVSGIEVPDSDQEPLKVNFQDGSQIEADMFLFASGRNGHSASLRCDLAGVKIGKRELIEVDEQYRTNVPHIYAIGDVIGFPSLASTSMDQGRAAVAHIFNTKDLDSLPKILPYGIYTIPEVSMVGMTEAEASQQNIPYCVGRARYKDMPRGKIMGLDEGYLKLIFRRDDLAVIGVHIIGHNASELIHFGMALVANKTTVQEIIAIVFNFPTMHELYKYASYDGLGNLSGHKIKTLDEL